MNIRKISRQGLARLQKNQERYSKGKSMHYKNLRPPNLSVHFLFIWTTIAKFEMRLIMIDNIVNKCISS